MRDPIDYLVARDLQAALRQMSTTAGYHYTVADEAVKLDPNQDVEALVAEFAPRPVVLLEVKPETWQYQPAGDLRLTVPVTVHWFCSVPIDELPISRDESRLRTFLRGCADIERAIAVDTTRGGLAVDTRIVKRDADPTLDGLVVWAMVDLEILLHRTFGEPDVTV